MLACDTSADTLAWKLQLLQQGSEVVEPLLPQISQRVFLLVRTRDPGRQCGAEHLNRSYVQLYVLPPACDLLIAAVLCELCRWATKTS